MSAATVLNSASSSSRIPGELQALLRHSTGTSFEAQSTPVLALGVRELDQVLPDGGLPCGQITELSVASGATDWVRGTATGTHSPTSHTVPMSVGAGLGTTIGLWACRAAQERAALHGSKAWCAFVDPSQTLHAPGVVQAGVDLERLLVVCPPLESLERVVLRLAEANSFAVIVVDTLSLTAQNPRALQSWSKVIRRLALSLRSTQAMVLLLTDQAALRSTPLPVGLRLELSLKRHLECFSTASEVASGARRVVTTRELGVTVAKHKHGRISEERVIRLPSRHWGSSEDTLKKTALLQESTPANTVALFESMSVADSSSSRQEPKRIEAPLLNQAG